MTYRIVEFCKKTLRGYTMLVDTFSHDIVDGGRGTRPPDLVP